MGASLYSAIHPGQPPASGSRPRPRAVPESPVATNPHAWLNGALLVSCVGLLLWGSWLLSRPGTLPIQYVRITGDFRQLQPEQLQTLVTNEVRGGFFNINVNSIRDILLQDPWVEDVMVQRVWPETLRVTVTEHVPLVRWGADSLLNTRGERFTPAPDSIPRTLPVLNGPAGSEALLLRRFREINQRLAPIGMSLTQLHQDSRRSWHLVVDAGFSVVLGRREFSRRLDRFVAVAPAALADRLAEVEAVDMRYTNGFAVSWKQQDL